MSHNILLLGLQKRTRKFSFSYYLIIIIENTWFLLWLQTFPGIYYVFSFEGASVNNKRHGNGCPKEWRGRVRVNILVTPVYMLLSCKKTSKIILILIKKYIAKIILL
jgi:hypothetical protein